MSEEIKVKFKFELGDKVKHVAEEYIITVEAKLEV